MDFRKNRASRALYSSLKFNSRGLSLVETMIGLGGLSLVLVGAMDFQELELRRVQFLRLSASCTALKAKVHQYVLDRSEVTQSATSSIYSSLGSNTSGNEALNYCLNGPPSAVTSLCSGADFPEGCCKADVIQPFILLDPADSTHRTIFSGTDLATAPLAPTSSSPARYDGSGMPCSVASNSCVLELVTTFTARCPGGASSCRKAQSIFIDYSVRVASGFEISNSTSLKVLKPASPILLAQAAPIVGAQFVSAFKVTRNNFFKKTGGNTPNTPLLIEIQQACQTEFGSDYRPIFIQECSLYSIDPLSTCPLQYRSKFKTGDGSLNVHADSMSGNNNYGVGCLSKKMAPLVWTTTALTLTKGGGNEQYPDSPTVADLNAKCSSDLGPEYQAAHFRDANVYVKNTNTDWQQRTFFINNEKENDSAPKVFCPNNCMDGKAHQVACSRKN